MAIEESGPNPERLAAAAHAQLNWLSGAVPIEAIARALDIAEIRLAARRMIVDDRREPMTCFDKEDFRRFSWSYRFLLTECFRHERRAAS
jgi:hypothetical protein